MKTTQMIFKGGTRTYAKRKNPLVGKGSNL